MKTSIYDGGYGFIGRIGCVKPMFLDESTTLQFYRIAPEGVSLVTANIGIREVKSEDVNQALTRIEDAVTQLIKVKPDCIIMTGAPPVVAGGYGSEKIILDRLEKASSGLPCALGFIAAIEALQKMRANKLAVCTPFPEAMNIQLKDFLEKSGFTVRKIMSYAEDYVNLMQMPLNKTYQVAKTCFNEARDADAIYFAGEPAPVVDNIEILEREFDTTVISAMAATLWKGLSMINKPQTIQGFGKFLRQFPK